MQRKMTFAATDIPMSAAHLRPLFDAAQSHLDIVFFERKFNELTQDARKKNETPFFRIQLLKDNLKKQYDNQKLSAREYINRLLRIYFLSTHSIYT